MSTSGFCLYNYQRQIQYIAIQALGQGGFGSVWSGHTGYGQPVAIKVIKPTANTQADFASWYTDQLVHLLVWNHPHVVRTIDQFVSFDGKLVIVMEMGGASLHSLVQQGTKWTDKSICAIGSQILSALSEIHSKGVIHRDVTLKNIISFPGGIFKLCDFGISKMNVQLGEYARTFAGTPSYIPPELHMLGYTTHASDIYQLGLVLLTLMVGRHPIPEGSSPAETRRMILEGVPRRLAESLIPKHGVTARILSKMLPRYSAHRFTNAAQVETAFTAEFWRLHNLEQFVARFLLLGQQAAPQ